MKPIGLQPGRRRGRFERKCDPKNTKNRPCKPLETNGVTDEAEACATKAAIFILFGARRAISTLLENAPTWGRPGGILRSRQLPPLAILAHQILIDLGGVGELHILAVPV